jgi:hypothetical protein
MRWRGQRISRQGIIEIAACHDCDDNAVSSVQTVNPSSRSRLGGASVRSRRSGSDRSSRSCRSRC